MIRIILVISYVKTIWFVYIFANMTNRLSERVSSISDFKTINSIDKGTFGTVYKVVHNKTKKIYALKRLEPLSEQKDFMREITLMNTNCHMTLTPVIHFNFESPTSNAFFTMPYYEEGSLERKIIETEDDNTFFNGTNRTIAAFGIAYGMKLLHDKKIIHRDLKTSNVLLDDNLEPVISDFGFSKVYKDAVEMSRFCGSPKFVAPECFTITDDNFLTSSIDVFSYSVVLHRLFNGKFIFSIRDSNLSPDYINERIQNGDRYYISSRVPEDWKEMIVQCWNQNPNDRPSFTRIVEWMENGDHLFPGADKDTFLEYVERVKNYSEKKDAEDDSSPPDTVDFDFSV
ncbi:hypothetical protein TRFO_33732 [Tritrichomonas foetus]|uniref:Protein kinase domain-containing protein n=1 Tax=Tritrichomonas foetus TaxID=1144522 RepID=A0A1J4JKY6_9EUKA|nr:hypothetical protein TRFO_33732 [Tritrichomonas foetus]|eukprot:OHS99768.1 hypothetical protein TRFO_33732 [Tritrichomonas foetus]